MRPRGAIEPRRAEERNGRMKETPEARQAIVRNAADQDVETPEKDAAQEQKQKARKKRRKALRGLLVRTLLLAAAVYVLFFQLVGLTVMPNGDMYPRIDAGDLVLFYRLDREPLAQDVIVLEKDVSALPTDKEAADEAAAGPIAPDSVRQNVTSAGNGTVKEKGWFRSLGEDLRLVRAEGKQMFICRVVAAPGDTVEITDEGRLIVNGNALIETNIFSQTVPYVGFVEYPLTLRSGEYFVMADLRNGGADSRFFGPVRTEDILGTVITIVRRNSL